MNRSRSEVAPCWQGNTPVSAGPQAMSPAAAMTGSAARAGAAPATRAARTAIDAMRSWERTIRSPGVDEAHAAAVVGRLGAPRRAGGGARGRPRSRTRSGTNDGPHDRTHDGPNDRT